MLRKWEVKSEGISIMEIVQRGVYVEYMYGTEKSNIFFLWLSKGIILFMVSIGTVIGFFDAFGFEYNKPLIIAYTAVLSIIMSLLFYFDKPFYIGVAVIALASVLTVYKFPIFIAGGFTAISDRIRETYADHYKQFFIKYPNPFCEDDYLCVTVTMLLIIAFLLVLYSITIVRYMSFAETFAISFILLEFPMFINQKLGLVPLFLVMAGCIACGMLRKTELDSFQHGARAVLMTIAFSAIFSIIMLIISSPVMDRELGEVPAGSIREFVDAKAETIALRGIPGLFIKNSVIGTNHGQLGKVADANPAMDTDLVVSFVPYSDQPVYLPGFFGINYTGNEWQDGIDVKDFKYASRFIGVDRIERDTFDYLDRALKGMSFNQSSSTRAKMEIAFVNHNFDTLLPYYTFPSGMGWADVPIYQPAQTEEGEEAEKPRRVDFFVPDRLEYKTVEDMYEVQIFYGNLRKLTDTSTFVGSSMNNEIYGYDYIYDTCLKVPDSLREYLSTFVAEHDNFGIEEIENYDEVKETEELWKARQDLIEEISDYTGASKGSFNTMSYDFLLKLKQSIERFRDYDVVTILPDGEVYSNPSENIIYDYDYDSGIDDWWNHTYIIETREHIEEEYEKRERNDEYRLAVCEAIRKMLASEYAYTLSPGMTPTDEEFVEYFLGTQKKGLCSHFASAAVMLLRYLGIPARYVEGYVIPSSLVKQSGTKQEMVDGNEWYPRDNDYNPNKDLYTVEVSDFYAHAWIEVYLEGKGFVPYEMTPLTYISQPKEKEDKTKENAEVTAAAKPTTAPEKDKEGEKEKEKTEDKAPDTAVIAQKEDEKETDLGFLIKTFVIITALGVLFWMLIILSRKGLYRLRCSRYLKNGSFKRLVYIRYCELVEKLRKKGIITEPNPLPMDLCIRIAEYNLKNEFGVDPEDVKTKGEGSEGDGIEDYEPGKYEKMVYMYYFRLFQYVEKVLYSSYKTDQEEYDDFYKKLKNCLVLGKD